MQEPNSRLSLFRYHNPILRYVTRAHPGYHPLVYQPISIFPYQAACSEGTFAPIASDCTKYNQCVNEKFVPFSCAEGLHWNKAINVCDWPENVNCVASPAPLGPGGIQKPGLAPLGPGGIQKPGLAPLGPGGIQQQVGDSGSNSDDDDVSVLVPVQVPATVAPSPVVAPTQAPATDLAPVTSQNTGKKVVCPTNTT